MSALKFNQLLILAENLRRYAIGSQLQDIVLTERYLFLQHYAKGNLIIGVELKPLAPRLGYFFGDIPKGRALVKPLVLFLKAHARNHRLKEVIVNEHLGRVIQLVYGHEQSCTVEIRLIPHNMNILVRAGDKSLSLFPAKDLPPSVKPEGDVAIENFNVEEYLDDWMSHLQTPATKKQSGNPQEDLQKKRNKELSKKQVLVAKLENDLLNLTKPWAEVGEYLKTNLSLEVPDDWQPLLDKSLPVVANMQRCFENQKIQERRREQILERIDHLKSELRELEVAPAGATADLERPVRSMASELLTKAKAKGRKLILSEGIEAVFGKSAKDNLALLRRAQAWDLWLHLRDLPGSHLIIRRPRQKNVDHHLLLQAARWLLNETLGKKKVIDGDRYDVIVTECRFVKPIKGDRLGRVNYQNEMTLSLKL